MVGVEISFDQAARGCCLLVHHPPEKFKEVKTFRQIFRSTKRPVMARPVEMLLEWMECHGDDERIGWLALRR